MRFAYVVILSAMMASSTLFGQVQHKPLIDDASVGRSRAAEPAKPNVPAVEAKVVKPVVILYECDLKQCDSGVHGLWIFEGEHGEAIWPYGAVADLTVKNFDGKRVVIERVDRSESSSMNVADPITHTFHATYDATLAADGKSFDGTVDFSGDFNGVKGAIGPFHMNVGNGIVCANPGDCSVGSEEIETAGVNALNAKLLRAAFKCFQASQKLGNLDGQAFVGLMTLRGIATTPNHTEGLELLTNAANGGSLVGQHALGKIYAEGTDGMPKDPRLAAFWSAAEEKTVQARATTRIAGQQGMGLLIMGLLGAMQGGSQADPNEGHSANWDSMACRYGEQQCW